MADGRWLDDKNKNCFFESSVRGSPDDHRREHPGWIDLQDPSTMYVARGCYLVIASLESAPEASKKTGKGAVLQPRRQLDAFRRTPEAKAIRVNVVVRPGASFT